MLQNWRRTFGSEEGRCVGPTKQNLAALLPLTGRVLVVLAAVLGDVLLVSRDHGAVGLLVVDVHLASALGAQC